MSTETLSMRLPTSIEMERAGEAVAPMSQVLANTGALQLTISEDGREVEIELPLAVAELVLDLLNHVSRGEMVTFVPYGAELTTQKAADLLNVSRPFLTKLLEQGEIAFHNVGTHRRVKVKDLLDYKAKRDTQRSEALKELQRLGQECDAK